LRDDRADRTGGFFFFLPASGLGGRRFRFATSLSLLASPPSSMPGAISFAVLRVRGARRQR
jgi:hypothetical protein